jgi:hypothetical protein
VIQPIDPNDPEQTLNMSLAELEAAADGTGLAEPAKAGKS